MKSHCLLPLLVVLSIGSAYADVYRWIDKNGQTVYSDTPPPLDAKVVDKRRANANASDSLEMPYATQQAMKKHPVTLFSTNCGDPCDKAKALLAKRGVPHTLKNPESSREEADQLSALVGALEVPTLLVGQDKPIKGFEEGAWTALLDSAGYPKTNPGVRGELAQSAAKDKPKAKSESESQPDAKSTANPAAKVGPYAEGNDSPR